MNPYCEHPGAIAAKDQNRAAYREWRNTFTPAEWESRKFQWLIKNGATIGTDGRLQIQVTVTL